MNIDITRVEMLKFQVEQLKNLIASKDALSSELEKTQKAYSSARKIREEFESLCETEEDYKQLQEYAQKEKEIVDLINEYAKQFGDINAELESYDEAKAKEVNQFLDVMSSHQQISQDIQAAEALSKKSKGDKVEVLSAEGRKKMIAVELVDDYAELVSRKKAYAKQMLPLYKKINNIGEVKMTDIVKNNTVVDESVEIITVEPIEENIDLWESLSDEKKVKELTERLDRIKASFTKPGMGKKRYINVDGQKMDVPVCLIGVYNATKGELKKAQAKVADKNKPIEQVEEIKQPEILPETPNQVNQIPEGQEIVSVTKPKTNMFDKIKAKAIVITVAIVTVVVITSALMMVNFNHRNNNTNGPAVNPTTITVTTTNDGSQVQQTPTVTPAGNTNQQVANPTVAPTNNNQQFGDSTVAPATNDAQQVGGVTVTPATTNENSVLSLGDEININDQSYIYKTAADAVNGTNRYKPYFDNTSLRVVRGISYELANGTLYTLFDNDPEFAIKQQTLADSGAIKKGVLTSVKGNESGYEGFYNISDTKTNVMEVSNGRSK